ISRTKRSERAADDRRHAARRRNGRRHGCRRAGGTDADAGCRGDVMLGAFQFMKIGNLDIRWPRARARVDTSVVGKDMSGVFAISEFEPWWLALHQTL